MSKKKKKKEAPAKAVREVVVGIRVSEEEHDVLQRAADRMALPVSTYGRVKLMEIARKEDA